MLQVRFFGQISHNGSFYESFSEVGNKMRVGIAQLNPVVGDLDGNFCLAVDAYEQLTGQGADFVVFPELALCGYPPRDLLFKNQFLSDLSNKLKEFADQTGPTPALIGFAEKISDAEPQTFNSAAWCTEGKIDKIFRKRLLPTYDVFDETRYFKPGKNDLFVKFKGKKIAVTICEDVWNLDKVRYENDPLDEIIEQGMDLLINLSASPWHMGKQNTRKNLLNDLYDRTNCPIIYVNAVGGNDELIFDGASMSINQTGEIAGQASSFKESIEIHELEQEFTDIRNNSNEMDDLHDALVLGLRDYTFKSGFTKGLVGLSGGIDSAVTAALAAEALGPENVIGISLPSEISSDHSKDDARELASNLGIEFHTLPIQSVVDAANEELKPIFGDLPMDVTEENLQARSRGLLLMAISNKFGALLLTTGNKSELAVGYCTLYGDMCGGLAVISDVPKTQVFALARHINRAKVIIPENTIEKPPSAELRPDQLDSDSLPDYDILDRILQALVDLNEYKRKQAAPGLKTTPLAFGIGRRIPIVQKYPH